MFRLIVEGPRAAGKTWFIHNVLIPALREHGYGANFFDNDQTDASMFLTDPEHKTIEVRERWQRSE